MESKTTSNSVVKYNDVSTDSKKELCLKSEITPTLIVSDASTDCASFSSDYGNFSSIHLHNFSSTTFKNSNDLNSNTNKDFDFKRLKTYSCNANGTETSFDSNNHLFLPLKGYDSAYGSSMESHSENVSPSAYSNDGDEHECLTDDMDHGDDAPYINCNNKLAENKKLSTFFSSTSTPVFNTEKSKSSFGLVSLPKLESDKPVGVPKNSSSAFSFKFSHSFDLSEGKNIGLFIDCPKPFQLSRKESRAKARNSWQKLRSVVKWSPFVQSFKKKYPWIQLAGHEGCFQPGREGSILKKFVAREAECLEGFASDPTLRTFVPAFYGTESKDNEKFLRMQDLLLSFESPSIMDCKMGIRTYLEDDLTKAKVNPCMRNDMYKKMIEISPNEPTEEEKKVEGVTKPRYMQWREKVSSSSSLGFRIEGVKKSNLPPNKDYKLTKTVKQVKDAFQYFIGDNVVVLEKYIERLKSMKCALENSDFFNNHEVIGSSLLFVHDSTNLANIWMIDFGKTSRLPPQQKINHRSVWEEGNREDGFLLGMDNMIDIFEAILVQLRKD